MRCIQLTFDDILSPQPVTAVHYHYGGPKDMDCVQYGHEWAQVNRHQLICRRCHTTRTESL